MNNNRLSVILKASIEAGTMDSLEAMTIQACIVEIDLLIKRNEAKKFTDSYGTFTVALVSNLVNKK